MARKRRKPAYPPKFRMKLERMAAERDRRAGVAPPPAADNTRSSTPFDTAWRAFHRPASVHLMHARMADDQRSLTMVTYIRDPSPRRVTVSPPWAELGMPLDPEIPAQAA